MNYTKQELKDKLLSIGLVEDNEYLDKYVELIVSNKDTKKEEHTTFKHHVIPKFYYKYHNTKVDNSENNIVNLTYDEHVIAHCYLEMCSVSPFIGKNYYGIFMFIGKRKLSKNDIFDMIDKFDSGQQIVQHLKSVYIFTDEHKHNLKLATKNRKSTHGDNISDSGYVGGVTGLKVLYDLSGKKRYVSKEDYSNLIGQGWTKPTNKKHGDQPNPCTTQKHVYVSHMSKEEKHHNLSISHLGISPPNKGVHCSDETKQKLSNYFSGRVWVNNGTTQKQVTKEESINYLQCGYRLGRISNNQKVEKW